MLNQLQMELFAEVYVVLYSLCDWSLRLLTGTLMNRYGTDLPPSTLSEFILVVTLVLISLLQSLAPYATKS